MQDLLEYPSCKLYDNGRFRLPNKVRKQFESWRVKQFVLIPFEDDKLKLIPASWWERMKTEEKKQVPVDFPVRPQSLSVTLLELHQDLIKFLGTTKYLHFEAKEKYYLLWNDTDYNRENEFMKEQIHKMYFGK